VNHLHELFLGDAFRHGGQALRRQDKLMDMLMDKFEDELIAV